MKILAVFLLAVLGWSLTESRVVSKCELWGELKNATANLVAPKRQNVDYFLAKIVCQVDQVSRLNTSAENQQKCQENEGRDSGQSNEGKHHGRRRRHDKGPSSPTNPPAQNCTSAACQQMLASGLNTSTENQQESQENDGGDSGESNEGKHHDRRRRHDKGPSSSGRHSPCSNPAQNCTLFGIFQLSNCQACNDSITQTANVCGIPCSNLLDDNIQDDISCLLKMASPSGPLNFYRDHLLEVLEDAAEIIGITPKEKCERVNLPCAR